MEQSGVKGSGCPEGPDCPGGPEVVGFLGVGPGVSSVLFLFHRLFLAHSSNMCIRAHQTASTLFWPSKPSLLLHLAPCFHAPWNRTHMANPNPASSVTIQTSADPKGFCFLLPTFWWSSARNRSSACLRAASHCAITSTDVFWTTSYDDLTFMVGSVRCVVVQTVSFIILARF